MSQGSVLVTGATGDTGGATVEQLMARGRRVRALAHREDARSTRLQELGAEVVFGDFLDLDAIRAAVQGVQHAYFCYPIRPGIIQATAYFAQAAKEAGIDCVVNMSQISAREHAKSHAAQDHWLAERVFDWSGVTVAHLRPTYFAEWLLYLAPMIRAGLLHVPFGPGRHAPIAIEDQARVIVGILEDSTSHRGKIYALYGAVEFTYEEIAQVLSRVLGKDIRYKQVSIETMLQILSSGGQKPPAEHSAKAMHGEFASSRAERWAFEQKPEGRTGDSFFIQHLREVAIDHQSGVFAGTNDVVKRIGGRQPTTLEEFMIKHRKAFA
jgi:uncharacterized protein YbjT (DUF2867 family)